MQWAVVVCVCVFLSQKYSNILGATDEKFNIVKKREIIYNNR